MCYSWGRKRAICGSFKVLPNLPNPHHVIRDKDRGLGYSTSILLVLHKTAHPWTTEGPGNTATRPAPLPTTHHPHTHTHMYQLCIKPYYTQLFYQLNLWEATRYGTWSWLITVQMCSVLKSLHRDSQWQHTFFLHYISTHYVCRGELIVWKSSGKQ